MIREAKMTDSLEITKMIRKLHEEEFSPKDLIPIERNYLISKIFLAEHEFKVVGFIWVNFIGYGTSKYGVIEELYVKPEFRAKGYGKMLIEQARSFFGKNSTEVVFVSIDKKNEKQAIGFYEKCGFERCKGLWYYMVP